MTDWLPQARATVAEFARKPDFASHTLQIECSLSKFEEKILPQSGKVPAAKFEYVDGFAEITVFASSIIHNAIRFSKYGGWLSGLPGLPDLHSSKANNLRTLVHFTAGSLAKYREGDDVGKNSMVYAPDAQFSCQLSPYVHLGSIIFEVAYPDSYEHACKKAANYLWADRPRPCVVVIFNFSKHKEDTDYLSTILKYEVFRRGANDRSTVTHESGVYR